MNHAEDLVADVSEHPVEVPDNDADHGGVNHAEDFDADKEEQPVDVPDNDDNKSDGLFVGLQAAAMYQRYLDIDDYPSASSLSGCNARGYAAFVHFVENSASEHLKDKIAAIAELTVHLPEEGAMLRGPMQYDWMYPVERRLFYLKPYLKKSDLFGHGVLFTSRCEYGYFDGEIEEMVWFVLNSCDEIGQYREYVIGI